MYIALLSTVMVPKTGNQTKNTVFPAGLILFKNSDGLFESEGDSDIELELSPEDYFEIPQCVHFRYQSGCSSCIAQVNAELRAATLWKTAIQDLSLGADDVLAKGTYDR